MQRVPDDQEGAEGSPCRLYVCLAQRAPIGVVLRRGPSDWSRLSVWHTDTDTFEHGQWLRGRVYHRRCDVSPDGSLFVYFVHKATGQGDVKADSWAAISRPPWFTALALWPVGTTYFGGGFFGRDGGLFLSGLLDPPDIGALPDWLQLTRDIPYVDHTNEWSDRTVWVNRMLRDGWTCDDPNDASATWRHAHPEGSTLELEPLETDVTAYGGRHQQTYALSHVNGTREDIGPATWADWDGHGRLVVARDGALWAGAENGGLRLIADFNDAAPDPRPAPPEGRIWPRRTR